MDDWRMIVIWNAYDQSVEYPAEQNVDKIMGWKLPTDFIVYEAM